MDVRCVLIAPNVSEQMGGEAMKALHIFRELRKVSPDTIQITHERNRAEIDGRLKLTGVHFINDTWVSRTFWRVRALRLLLNPWFSWKAVKLADQLAGTSQERPVVIWQTEPNSPVAPRSMSKAHLNVLGPINGNIYYPPAFRQHESTLAKWRRRTHMPLQRLQRLVGSTMSKADLILVAGGNRTRDSLLTAGCRADRLLDAADCGVDASLLDRPRIEHAGRNDRFVHFGRLVFHKGTALIIQALAHTEASVCLDVIGRGPELDTCKDLAQSLRLGDRVRFLDWYPNRDQLLDSLRAYRGVVFPSFEDANGMVVQEAMAMGLPPICIDWGGPQLLIEHKVSGYLVPVHDPEQIAKGLAVCMDELAAEGDRAEKMSTAAREHAEAWRWPTLASTWLQEIGARANDRAATRKVS